MSGGVGGEFEVSARAELGPEVAAAHAPRWPGWLRLATLFGLSSLLWLLLFATSWGVGKLVGR